MLQTDEDPLQNLGHFCRNEQNKRNLSRSMIQIQLVPVTNKARENARGRMRWKKIIIAAHKNSN